MSDVQNSGGTPKVARVTFHDVTESDDSATERQEPRPMPQGILRRPSNFPFSLKMPFQTLHEDNKSNNDSDSIHSPEESEINRRRPSLAVQIITAPARWVPNHHHQEYRKRKMSLHGKPIYFTVPSKRKSRMLQMRIEAYNFLERPNFKPCSIFYHTFTFLLVFGCLVLSVLSTIPNHMEKANKILFIVEVLILILFGLELGVRIWSAGCRCRYQGFLGRMRFCKKPLCIIDIIVVMSSFVVLCIGSNGHMFAATAMRSLRFLQILRMVRMDRRGGSWKLLSSVVRAHSKELITAWYIGFLALIFASFLVYQAEKDENSKEFETFADALWWGLITLTTIGYGEKVPITWLGRLIASVFAILGISFFALPAGILGSGFALKVQEQNRQKHFARRRMPAAYLLQCMWRCYAADKNSRSVATWKPHLRPQNTGKKSIRDKLKSNPSPRLSRRQTFKSRRGGSSKSTVVSPPAVGSEPITPMLPGYSTSRNEIVKSQSLAERLTDRISRQNSIRVPWREKVTGADSDDSSSSITNLVETGLTELTEQHKVAIRAIRMMKFFVARRKFKEALRPYDVKDVIEQYSAGHVDMLSRIKLLQNRVDCILGIGTDGGAVGNTRGTRTGEGHCGNFPKPPPSINSRLHSVEIDVKKVDQKLDQVIQLLTSDKKNGKVRRKATVFTQPKMDLEENSKNIKDHRNGKSSAPKWPASSHNKALKATMKPARSWGILPMNDSPDNEVCDETKESIVTSEEPPVTTTLLKEENKIQSEKGKRESTSNFSNEPKKIKTPDENNSETEENKNTNSNIEGLVKEKKSPCDCDSFTDISDCLDHVEKREMGNTPADDDVSPESIKLLKKKHFSKNLMNLHRKIGLSKKDRRRSVDGVVKFSTNPRLLCDALDRRSWSCDTGDDESKSLVLFPEIESPDWLKFGTKDESSTIVVDELPIKNGELCFWEPLTGSGMDKVEKNNHRTTNNGNHLLKDGPNGFTKPHNFAENYP
ncbi:voltage gated potassium channel subunit isoform X2 [Ciona intestinalis]